MKKRFPQIVMTAVSLIIILSVLLLAAGCGGTSSAQDSSKVLKVGMIIASHWSSSGKR